MIGKIFASLLLLLVVGCTPKDKPAHSGPFISIAVSPSAATIQTEATFEYSATISGSTRVAQWSLLGIRSGYIDRTGLYTAPVTPGTYFVQASLYGVRATAAVSVVDWWWRAFSDDAVFFNGQVAPGKLNQVLYAGGAWRNDAQRLEDIWISQLSAKGETAWQFRLHRSNSSNYLSRIIATDDGGVILRGSITDGGPNGYYVAKLSQKGSIEWQKFYGRNSQYYLAGLSPKTNGDFLALGSKTNQLNDAWIGELNSTGGIIGAKSMTAAGQDSLELAIPRPSGGHLLYGSTSSFQAQGFDIWQLQLDAPGNLLSQMTLGTQYNEDKVSGVLWEGSDLILCIDLSRPATSGPIYHTFNFLLARVSHDGIPRWTQLWGDDSRASCSGLVRLQNGNIMVIGSVHDYDENLLFLEVTPDGKEVSQFAIGSPEVDSVSVPGILENNLLIAGTLSARLFVGLLPLTTAISFVPSSGITVRKSDYKQRSIELTTHVTSASFSPVTLTTSPGDFVAENTWAKNEIIAPAP